MSDWRDATEALRYEPSTGAFFWKCRPRDHFATDLAHRSWNTKFAGRRAFTKKDRYGYCCGKLFNRDVKAHRLAWLLHYGEWPSGVIDHINGDPADNRIANLRAVEQRDNLRNAKLCKRNKSGVVGVRRCTNARTWQAAIRRDGRTVHLGCFPSLEAAADARRKAESELGYHLNHGRKEPVQ